MSLCLFVHFSPVLCLLNCLSDLSCPVPGELSGDADFGPDLAQFGQVASAASCHSSGSGAGGVSPLGSFTITQLSSVSNLLADPFLLP